MSQAGLIDVEKSNPQIATSFETDSGTAIPIANVLELLATTVPGDSTPIETVGSGNTVTINLQISQAIAATDATKVGVASFDSSQFTVDGNGFVSLAGGGAAIDSLGVQATSGTGTDPVLPDGAGNIEVEGATVAAGTNPVRSVSTASNTLQMQVQTSQAIPITNATNIGLAAFDSAAFDVDANGFVQLNGGGLAATSFDVQANTAPGTDPVVPSGAGVLTINGGAVANHSVVLETHSRAANAVNVEVQYATSSASTDATKSGVAHFDSTDFSVDANGFVALAGAGAGQTITGDSGGALPPTAGNWNIVGLSGSKTSGSGSTLTVKSPPYADFPATATAAVNSGSFITAGGNIILDLPAVAADGDLVEVICTTANLVAIDAPALNFIRIGTLITSVGGTATSTQIGDAICLRYHLATLTWYASSVVGTWVIA